MKPSNRARIALRVVALTYLGVLLLIPIALILWRSFDRGLLQFWRSITTPAAISALELSIIIVIIVVPLNAIFGLVAAFALARGKFRGKTLLRGIIDLPFAVSPIIVGVALVLLWGRGGWFGGIDSTSFRVIYALPGMVLATIFVTLPFVVREVEPVLRELGTDQEEAAALLGASRWQTLRKVTLPALKWGLIYGIVLTIARALGEFGAVTIVSSGYPGRSQTLTLLVNSRYTDDYNEFGAYTAATLLMIVAVLVLTVMTIVERRTTAPQRQQVEDEMR